MNIFESSEAEPRTSITQGDLIQIFTGEEVSYGIIVTGECDIVQKKFSNIFSYVELHPAEEYAYKFIIVPVLEMLAEEIPDQFTLKLQQTTQFRGTDYSMLYQRFFGDEDFPSIENVELSKLHLDCRQVLIHIKEIVGALCRISPIKDKLQKISDISRKIGCKTKCPTAESLIQKLSADPGDLFYVGGLPNAEVDLHYIASLRILREIHKSQVFARPSALKDANKKHTYARLMSRLTAPYRYRLTQKLAAVFSDIGLPGNFEGYRGESLKKVFQ